MHRLEDASSLHGFKWGGGRGTSKSLKTRILTNTNVLGGSPGLVIYDRRGFIRLGTGVVWS